VTVEVTDADALPMGTRIGESYVVDDVLGVGGMGTVYSAVHEPLGRHVAIKVLHPEYAQHEEYRQRFVREARVLAQLHHPGVVAVHDFGEHRGMLYLVMDLLAGRSLRRELSALAGPMELPRALRLVRQLAEVLAAAHLLPLVHRDLKPENVMIEPGARAGEERAVLVDFGLAFIGGAGADLGRMTRSLVVPGTPHYVSPEQARAVELGPPSDIYSLGCLTFEVLSGRPPFEAPSATELIAAHLFVPPPSLRARRPEQGFPEALDELLAAMLGKAPEERPTAIQVLDVLDAVLERPDR
jgi:serine/threonine-protein kinase